MNNLDIASLAMIEAESNSSATNMVGWKWKKGVVLFPEVKCPYCREIIVSKAIWVVGSTTLEGQFVPVKGIAPKLEKPDHPHVIPPKEICFGTATEPLQALFGGLNPNSTVTSMVKWLEGKYWDHHCNQMRMYDEDDDDLYTCANCGERIESYWTYGDEYYCSDCFNYVAFECYGCSVTFSIDDQICGGNESWCQDCWSERYFRCDECEEVFNIRKDAGDGKCEDCYEPPASCVKCEDLLSTSENEEGTGYCNKCHECSECGGRMTDILDIEAGKCWECVNGVEEEPDGDVPDTGEDIEAGV